MSKRVNIYKVRHAAYRCGLRVVVHGASNHFHYEFLDKTTGEWVLMYYPVTKRWFARGYKQGTAEGYREALDVISSAHRKDSRTERNKPANS